MNAFKRLRLKSGQTVQEVAETMAVSQSCIYNIERGRSKPLVTKLNDYAKALGCSLDDIIDAIDETS